jgi:hypothetical protein
MDPQFTKVGKMAILPALSCSRADGYWPQPHFNTGGMTTDTGWKTTIDLFFLGEAVDIFDRISLELVL